MPLLNVLTKILRKTVNTQNAVLLESKHRDFSVIAMIHKTQIRHSFLQKTIKRRLENTQKEKEQRKRQREKGRERLVRHAPSVSSRTCSTKSVKSSQESLQTAKRKEKKDKMSCRQERKVLLKIRFPKG